MKKLIIATLLVGLSAFLIAVGGPYNTQSFINGQSVVMEVPASASSTTIGITTSVRYTNDLGQLVTNGTNAAGITYGSWSRPVTVRANSLGDAAVYSISLLTTGGTTNTFALTFQRSWDGSNFDTNVTWGFTSTADLNSAGAVAVTNVPTWFVTGVSHLRVASIVHGTNGIGATNAITALRLNGFAP